MTTRLLVLLSTFVFTTFYSTVSAQSYVFNDTRATKPIATAIAANFTVNSTAKHLNSTDYFFSALGGDQDGVHTDKKDDDDEDSDDEDNDDDASDDDDDDDASDDDDKSTTGSMKTHFVNTDNAIRSSLNQTGFILGDPLNAISTIRSTYRNWIGSALGKATKAACYRKAHIAKTCPLGFNAKLGMCWAQCPYAYPIECGIECIRHNDKCLLEIVSKVSAVAQAAFSIAPNNVYGKFSLMAKGTQLAFKCSKEIMGLVKSLTRYIRVIKVTDPHATQEKVLKMLYQTDNVVFDIPVTIATCLGIPVNENFKFADRLLNTAELILHDITVNSAVIVSDWSAFTSFMEHIHFGEHIKKLNDTEITSLKSAFKSNSTCGYDMKRLLDRTWMTVAEMRRRDSSISEDDIRVAMSKSNLALYEIPTVTNNCMAELIFDSGLEAAYTTRDTLRKGMGSIIDDLIKSGTSNNGTFLTATQYMIEIADKVATFYAVWEKKNIGGVMSEFFQPICGPTEFIGEIDDGSAKDAIGLKTVEKAFENSSGNWTTKGDGSVVITFRSMDKKDVTVNIRSGGKKVDNVALAAGKSVRWNSTVAVLEGKTLEMDRWRPGFLGIPMLTGGSLVLWVPRTKQGGSLHLTVLLNAS